MAASSSSLEARLRALELQVSSCVPQQQQATADVATRLQSLEQKQRMPQPLQQLWQEIERLEADLSPGTALTHQKQIMAPLLYRKQCILGQQDDFRQDLQQVAQLLHLLLIDQPDTSAATIITEQQVVNAPILVETAAATSNAAEHEERLDRLAASALDLQSRTRAAAAQLDRLLEQYARLTTAASEKLVLLEEDLRRREQKGQQP